jgi:hypothetical protein
MELMIAAIAKMAASTTHRVAAHLSLRVLTSAPTAKNIQNT